MRFLKFVRKPAAAPGVISGLFIGFRNASGTNVRSTDLVTYTDGSGSGYAPVDSIVVNGKITTVGFNGVNTDINNNIDGINWTKVANFGAYEFKSIAYGAGKYVVIDKYGRLFYSDDAVVWTAATSPLTTSIIAGRNASVRFGGGMFVACGADDRLISSTDGINWTFRNTLAAGILSYANGKWFGSGYYGANKWRSNDGLGWNTIPALIYNREYSNVVFSNGKYIIAGSDGMIYRSTDGISWSLLSGQFNAFSTKIYIKGLNIAFFAGNGYIVFSTDGGLTWSPRYLNSTHNWTAGLML